MAPFKEKKNGLISSALFYWNNKNYSFKTYIYVDVHTHIQKNFNPFAQNRIH